MSSRTKKKISHSNTLPRSNTKTKTRRRSSSLNKSRRINTSGKINSVFIEDNEGLLFDNLTGKTLGIMHGCFCPPHKGHYNSFKKAIVDLNLDILLLKSLNDNNPNSSRHGTPLNHTIKILELYAIKLKKETDCIVLIIKSPSSVFMKNNRPIKINKYGWIPHTIKQIYDINYVETEEDLLKPEKTISRNFQKLYFPELRRMEAEYKYKYIRYIREKDGLSATKFVNALIKYKDDRSEENKRECLKFIDHLNDEEQENYLSDVIQYKLK